VGAGRLTVGVALSTAALAVATAGANAACRNCAVGSDTPFGAYYWYGPSSSYAAAIYYNLAGCRWHRQRVWDWDGQYWVMRRVQVCP
jgi:hypothetical protein